MGLFRRNDKNAVLDRMLETKLFEYVMDEISDGKRNNGIWGQALVETEGDEKKAEAIYIKLRVQSLKDEIKLRNLIDIPTHKDVRERKIHFACIDKQYGKDPLDDFLNDQSEIARWNESGSGKDLSVAKNMKVGNLEDKFEEEFGLKIQKSL